MKKMSLPSKIFIALLLGAVVGIALEFVPPGFIRDRVLVDGVFLVGGRLFMNAFKLMVVPIVLVSLTLGVAGMHSPETLGRVGIKAILFYMITTMFAIAAGLAVAWFFTPGAGLTGSAIASSAAGQGSVVAQAAPPVTDVISAIVPDNLMRALSGDSMLQVIFLAIGGGLALALLGEKARRLKAILSELNEFNIKIIEMIMYFAPLGVFCLLGRTFATLGAGAVLPLLKFLFCIALGMTFQMVVVYCGMLKLMGGLSPRIFFQKFMPVIVVAFSTSSSNAALPVNIETLSKEMGVSERLSSLLLSLGATINMNGTAIMQGCAALFIAQLYGMDLSLMQMLTVVITATFASIGTAGVPGVGVIMLAMVLHSVNLPMEGMAVIMGVDRIIDMMRTVVNVTGDAVCGCIIAKSEREMDLETFKSGPKS